MTDHACEWKEVMVMVVYVGLRPRWSVLHTARASSLCWCLSWMEARRPASNHRQPSTATTQRITPTYTLQPSSTDPVHTIATLRPPTPPLQSPPRPRWPRSCALACPHQNPATPSPKHRTPQQAGPDNMASTRELIALPMPSILYSTS